MSPNVPGHRILEVIREVPGRRIVLRTELDGVQCSTRVILDARLDARHAPLVAELVLRGRGSLAGMPEAVGLVLEGYRVAARLPRDSRWWTHALAAGVTPDHHAYVSTRWMEGTPLHEVSGPLHDDVRVPVLMGVAFILHELHSRQLVYGDLKAENLILSADGLPALIDLDTVREVPAENLPAVTRDLTRSWAAPEQHQHHSYLASDIWAFAGLVESLSPGGAPPGWRELLRACRHPDPLRRPQTRMVYEVISGERTGELLDWEGRPTPASAGTERTERVGETPPGAEAPAVVRTERVADVGSPSVTSVVAEQVREEGPSRPQLPSCAGVVVGLFLVPLMLCVGGGLWLDQRYVDEANTAAEAALSGLRAYKTRPELNRDTRQRKALRDNAQAAWEIRTTARAGAVYALALVWEQGWQDSGRTWNDAAYLEAKAHLDRISGSNEPEALLAAATLAGASCRLRRTEATAVGDCSRSLDTLDRFFELLPDREDTRWLGVEGAWTEVLVLTDEAYAAGDARLPEAATILKRGLDRCELTEGWLSWAPVNGPEMLQDCLVLAGLAPDFKRYFAWSRLLLATDQVGGQPNADTLRHLYSAAGTGCDSVKVTRGKRGDYFYKGADWCLAVGHAARGARAEAMVLIERAADPSRPWTQLQAGLDAEESL